MRPAGLEEVFVGAGEKVDGGDSRALARLGNGVAEGRRAHGRGRGWARGHRLAARHDQQALHLLQGCAWTAGGC